MPAFGSVVLNTKTYTPSRNDGGITRWLERSSSSPQGFSPLNLEVRPPSAGIKNYKVISKLVVPVVADESTACNCEGDFLRQIGFEVTATINAGSLLAERTDAYVRFKEWVAHATFLAAFQNLDPVYG